MVPRSFSAALYRPVYATIVHLINRLNENPYHKNKFDTNRREWALAGRQVVPESFVIISDNISVNRIQLGNSEEQNFQAYKGFRVKLD